MSMGRMMAMALADVAGMANPMFSGDPFIVVDFQVFSLSEAGIEIELNGDIGSFTSTGPGAAIGTWDGGGTFVRADYDFRADKTGGFGNLDGPFLESIWYPGNQLIAFKISTMVVAFWSGTLRMRPAGGGADIDTAILNLTAESI